MNIHFSKNLLFYILLTTCLGAQTDSVVVETVFEEDTTILKFGYLIVECDSPGINIYVDEMLVGQIPIDQPIPLTAGKHTVTYLQPELLALMNQYYAEKEVGSLILHSLQTVYIVPDQTVAVNLWWRPYERELKSRKYRFWVKSVVGVVLMATLLSLNLP